MTTVTLTVESREEISRRFAAAMKGEAQGHFITFPTPELLFEVLNGHRWQILHMMIGTGPHTVDAIARHVGRPFGEVKGHIETLVNTGILDLDHGCSEVELPYEAVHIDFTIAGPSSNQ